jgi:hypothetical protein
MRMRSFTPTTKKSASRAGTGFTSSSHISSRGLEKAPSRRSRPEPYPKDNHVQCTHILPQVGRQSSPQQQIARWKKPQQQQQRQQLQQPFPTLRGIPPTRPAPTALCPGRETQLVAETAPGNRPLQGPHRQKHQQPEQPAPSPRSSAPTKSNTRNARSGTSTDEPTEAKPKRSPRNDSRSRGGDPSTVESARVYVGNLSYDVTEHDLEELFKGVGGVRGVEIVYNRATHRSKGYGFVEMLHKDEAMRSVEVLHDQPFMGRKLIVSGAKPAARMIARNRMAAMKAKNASSSPPSPLPPWSPRWPRKKRSSRP